MLKPFFANYQEPRVGVRKQIGSSRLKLDIGATFDVVEYALDNRHAVRVGVDFFTYALTTSSQGLRLQVDAVDGFFGGHIVYRTGDSLSSLALRLRLLHLSAHLIDGHFDNNTGQWFGGKLPIPFTRDFGEIVCAYSREALFSWTAYAGMSYATLVRPGEIQRFSWIGGVELSSREVPGMVFGRTCNAFVADHVNVSGVPAYVGTNNLEFGLKFGEWSGPGMRLYASYYRGLDIFSQYYNENVEHWGIGFAFDVW